MQTPFARDGLKTVSYAAWFLAFVVMITIGVAAQPVQAQETTRNADGKTVWDGVYTDAQAARGETQYQANCSACHRGGPRRDEEFTRDWSGSDVESLFSQIKESMPAGAPSSLNDDVYVDIVAYMLRVNAFPAGTSELTAGAIKSIRIEGSHGPEPVPNFVLVRTVGCLTKGPDTSWMLAGASEPVRTKDPAASKDEELKSSEAAVSGAQRFQLLNVYPRPDKYEGHTVEAKGFLIRDPGGNRINVTSVQALAPRCGQAN